MAVKGFGLRKSDAAMKGFVENVTGNHIRDQFDLSGEAAGRRDLKYLKEQIITVRGSPKQQKKNRDCDRDPRRRIGGTVCLL